MKSKGHTSKEVDPSIPAMPCVVTRPAGGQAHRPKNVPPLFNAAVARPVGKGELKSNPKARAAMDAEWARLRAIPRPDGGFGAWDESRVREASEVRAEAKAQGVKVHFGRVFGFVVEKNHELSPDDPKRKFKGRSVFQGNQVRDEHGEWAIFQDLGSCPASMEASRYGDAYGLFPGHCSQQADAEQAYRPCCRVRRLG